jgi:shikimate kinase/3-dehydroquinate synthase
MIDEHSNIILTGFMGTGKTTIAQAVAERLGRRWVDMDALIVACAGMSIPDIFRQQGEAAFRQHEQQMCEELSQEHDLVIATGGGALVDPANRERLSRDGLVICLDCEPEALLERLAGDENRPMLWGDDPAARLRELLQARQPSYAQISWHIDTTRRTTDEVVAEVLALYAARPTLWDVRTPTGAYPVHLLPGGLARLGALLRQRVSSPSVAVVSDETVWPLHGPRLLEGLRVSSLNPTLVLLPPGERHKNLDSVRLLYDRFIEAGLDRSAAVLALGGGVITDMAGFAASTYLRGVPFAPLPTTLLGMVDAAVGGKVAVDHPRGKNLVGAFVRPLLVLVDPDTLATLPPIEQRAGLAEVLKAGIIGDAELFEAFEPGATPRELRWLVERALALKIAVVEEDPYEQGRRAVLNLGHTFAHAFELLAHYGLHHGLAVSIGIAAAAHLAELRGHCSAHTRQRILAALHHHDLPTRYDAYEPAQVLAAMASDKKRQGSRLRFVLPRAIGDVLVDGEVPAEQVILALERIRS